MITHDLTFTYSIDYGRPSFSDDHSRSIWKKFFDLVETSNIPIGVNAIHNHMVQLVNEGGSYMGGGFKFCYFFQSKSDRRAFANECKTIGFEVDDFRNVYLFLNNDNTMHLRFNIKYLQYVIEYVKNNNLDVLMPIAQMDYPDPITGEKIVVDNTYIVNSSLDNLNKLKAHLTECFFELD